MRLTRLQVTLSIGIPAAFALLLTVAVLAGQPNSTPDQISRDELVAEYNRLLPDGPSPTPEFIDIRTAAACKQLSAGVDADILITANAGGFDGAVKSKAVLRLFALYRCPEHADQFE